MHTACGTVSAAQGRCAGRAQAVGLGEVSVVQGQARSWVSCTTTLSKRSIWRSCSAAAAAGALGEMRKRSCEHLPDVAV